MPLLTLSIEHDIPEAHMLMAALLPAVTPGGGGALDRRVRFMGQDVKLSGAAHSPWLTGSLAHAHTFEASGGAARVFIDPAAVNRVTGRHPAEYGKYVHRRQPWLQATFESDAPRIVEHHLAGLVGDLEALV